MVTRAQGVVAKVSKDVIQELLSVRNKKSFEDISEEAFPFRTKTDRNLRRTRLLDVVIAYREAGRIQVCEKVLCNFSQGSDMIWVQMITLATLVFGEVWYDMLSQTGCFDSDVEHYSLVTKEASNAIKSFGLTTDEVDWRLFVECQNLVGYRNPPFPGFDVVKEARELADGGEPHEYFGMAWDDALREYLPTTPQSDPDYVTFEDFIRNGEWLTTGSSSVREKLEIELPNGKVVKVKPRKNMTLDVVSIDWLISEALNNKEQRNVVIVKAELGKIRLAVAGDILTYLQMTWVNIYIAGSYYGWEGNTMDEDFTQQTGRLARMLELCAQGFGLPYDYASFDHQPTKQELIAIVRHVCAGARSNVPTSGLDEYDAVVARIIEGWDTADLMVRDDKGEKTHFPVTGGLMSGLRWTTLVGNAWNTVMTGLAMRVLELWGFDTSSVVRYIRGDDSAIFTETWETAAAMNVAYDAIGALGGAGKFAIKHHEMEFLRVWFDTRCHGYPTRAVSSLVQRKPWSSEPWTADMAIRAVFEGVRTMRRRLENLDRSGIEAFWQSTSRIWCRDHALPRAALWTPVFAGGLGVEPPRPGERWKLEPPIPKVNLEGVRPLNQTTYRADRATEYAKERYDLEIAPDDATRIAQRELAATLTADNLPSVASAIREEWNETVRGMKIRATMTEMELPQEVDPFPIGLYEPKDVGKLVQELGARVPAFGSHPEIQVARADFTRFRMPGGFMSFLRTYYPQVVVALDGFHRKWHVSEALDYLQGATTVRPEVIHPAITDVLVKMVADMSPPKLPPIRYMTIWMGKILEPRLWLSPLSQRTYLW
jgi:hypothetical protein